MKALDPNARRAYEIAARTTSIISLVGSLFIISTYLFYAGFRKPINRLVFYASLGNLLCNIATLISTSGPKYGERSALCQIQGFLIQMFIPADSLWAFCMALNVYLTFFKNYNSAMLRRLEKWYFVFCYGIPFVPALVYLLIDAIEKKGIYGSATLWCWIAREYDWMRIAFFYGPVWVVILVTTGIYLRTGKDIFKQRAALRAFNRDPSDSVRVLNPFNAPVTGVAKITEIRVTTESVNPQPNTDGSNKVAPPDAESRSSYSSTRNLSEPGTAKSEAPPRHGAWRQSVEIPADKGHIHDSDTAYQWTTSVSAGVPLPTLKPEDETESVSTKFHGDHNRKRNNATLRANTAAWGYTKVALLMFFALFVVWVPATVNRLHQAISDEPVFALNFIAALVLPLQGFWNCMVYISTSWSQSKKMFRELLGIRGNRADESHIRRTIHQQHLPNRNIRRGDSQDLSLQEAIDMDPSLDAYDLEVDTEQMKISSGSKKRGILSPIRDLSKHRAPSTTSVAPSQPDSMTGLTAFPASNGRLSQGNL